MQMQSQQVKHAHVLYNGHSLDNMHVRDQAALIHSGN
jgi:hypothetical protein